MVQVAEPTARWMLVPAGRCRPGCGGAGRGDVQAAGVGEALLRDPLGRPGRGGGGDVQGPDRRAPQKTRDANSSRITGGRRTPGRSRRRGAARHARAGGAVAKAREPATVTAPASARAAAGENQAATVTARAGPVT